MISMIASLILAAHTGNSRVDYIVDCIAVDLPYELNKGMRDDIAPLFSVLHCTCMLDTTLFVGQMGGGIPDYMLADINKNCRAKTKALLTPKPNKKPAPCK